MRLILGDNKQSIEIQYSNTKIKSKFLSFTHHIIDLTDIKDVYDIFTCIDVIDTIVTEHILEHLTLAEIIGEHKLIKISSTFEQHY